MLTPRPAPTWMVRSLAAERDACNRLFVNLTARSSPPRNLLSWLAANPLFPLTCQLRFRNQLSSFEGHRSGLELSQRLSISAFATSALARVVTRSIAVGEPFDFSRNDVTRQLTPGARIDGPRAFRLDPLFCNDLRRLASRTGALRFERDQSGVEGNPKGLPSQPEASASNSRTLWLTGSSS